MGRCVAVLGGVATRANCSLVSLPPFDKSVDVASLIWISLDFQGMGVLPYYNFRTESEQAVLREEQLLRPHMNCPACGSPIGPVDELIEELVRKHIRDGVRETLMLASDDKSST
jgi:hypothetical protein